MVTSHFQVERQRQALRQCAQRWVFGVAVAGFVLCLARPARALDSAQRAASFNSVQGAVGPQFQQTAAFYVLCGGLGLALLGGLCLVRARHLESKQRARQRTRDELEIEARQSTAELANSVSVLKAALESTADGLLVIDRQGRVVMCNRKFLEMWRLPPGKIGAGTEDELLSLVLRLVKEDGAFLAKVREIGRQADAESSNVVELKDGRIFERHSMPQRLGDEIVGRVWCYRDVTEWKRIEHEIIGSRNFLDRIINSVGDPIFVKDQQHRGVLVNDAFCSLMGCTRAELLGKSDDDHACYSEGEANTFKSQDQLVFETGRESVNEETLTSMDGTAHHLTTKKTLYVDDQGDKFIVGVSRDVSDRKRAEAELAYERDLLRALLDSTPDAIYFKDLHSRFLRCSRSMAEIFQAGKIDGLIGKTDLDLFTTEHAGQALRDEQEIIRTGQPIIAKIEKETWTDGRVSWALTSKMPLRNVEGEIIGTLGISKDITPIKDAEAKLNAAHRQLLDISRQAGMAEVATSVLHNVGNVLNSVNVSVALVADTLKRSKIGNVERLAALVHEHRDDLVSFFATHPKGKQVPEYLAGLAAHLAREQAALLQEIEGMGKNVGHIKDIVMMQQNYATVSGVAEKVGVVELVEDALRMNSNALARHGVEVIRDYSPDVPEITVDRHKVLQILINLVRNARDACEESGRTDRRLTVQIHHRPGHIQISMADNGVGIPVQNMARIFNHGFTTRKNGHGFGLHSGALAARELGGALTAQSDGADRGARFSLELPLQPPTREGSLPAQG